MRTTGLIVLFLAATVSFSTTNANATEAIEESTPTQVEQPLVSQTKLTHKKKQWRKKSSWRGKRFRRELDQPRPATVPEIDGRTAPLALALLLGLFAMTRERKRA